MLDFSRVGFSGHETFPFRTGWLKKGFEEISRNPRVLTDQDAAMTLLGVGKNMVRSIRHWCLVTRIVEEGTRDGIKGLYPTAFGRDVFAKFDPYLEDMGTLWLIHWQIGTNSMKATTWYTVFSAWFQTEFTKDELVHFLQERIRDYGVTGIAESSIRRDVDCFVRTYVPARTSATLLLEDALDCPLTELNLIAELSDRKTYRFLRTTHSSLPDRVLAYMILRFWHDTARDRDTFSFEDLMYRPGSPGRILRIEENSMIERLERMEKVTKGAFSFTTSAGLKQLLRGWRKVEQPEEMLNEYYGGARNSEKQRAL